MFKRVLIANRGEIVRRVIRTCRDMGISTVAVYSQADQSMPYLAEADQAELIGPANPMASYLNIEAILEACRKSGAEAVHPGYGFLSENAAFAKAVAEAGLVWIGPSPQILSVIDSKSYCRELARRAEVPVIPGSDGAIDGPAAVAEFGQRHGYPMFLKLDKGGGGKGIERVDGPETIEEVYKRACSIGKMAFGSPECYLEKVVERPRHIEVQFVADFHGNVLCLGERECSIQRRHQKIIEEAPSPVVSLADRAKLYEYTRRLVKEMGYHGAGTVENLRGENGDYYFMEINARLQVEHPVSELVTGYDIVKMQLEVAAGKPLAVSQDDVTITGSAIEARVYAEDPDTFIPSPGNLDQVDLPEQGPALRIDHAMAAGGSVPPYYDPMLAKVIAWGEDRVSAAGALHQALSQIQVRGVKTSIPANLKILANQRFLQGDISTAFIEEEM